MEIERDRSTHLLKQDSSPGRIGYAGWIWKEYPNQRPRDQEPRGWVADSVMDQRIDRPCGQHAESSQAQGSRM